MDSIKSTHLQELIVALSGIKHANGDPVLSPDLTRLLAEGLHHAHLPEDLHPSAAEAMQMIFNATGGVARGILWADRNYSAFMKLYARQTIPTILPNIPPPQHENTAKDDWPPWMTARRLAYQLDTDPTSDPDDEP